jgi:septum formation protein
MKFIQKDRKIVLASQSPRRSQLLKQISIDFIVIASNFDESNIYYENPAEYVMALSNAKANEVLSSENLKDAIIIGADTTVYYNKGYLNKPENFEEAKKMLKSLSGNWHSVFTGVSVIDKLNNISKSTFSETKVKFRDLSDEEIDFYINTYRPFDKAGSYGIQDDFGAVFVEEIIGDYYNVVGLPLVKVYKILKEMII